MLRSCHAPVHSGMTIKALDDGGCNRHTAQASGQPGVKPESNLTCVQASNIMRTTRGQWSGRVITLSALLLLLLWPPLPAPAAAAAVRRVMARG